MASPRCQGACCSALVGGLVRVVVPAACCLVLGQAAVSPRGVRAAPPSVPAAERTHAELCALVGPKARAVTTKHFVVAYDTTIETVRRLTSRVEATSRGIEKFCTFNGIAYAPSKTPLEILLFDQPESFYRYAAALGVRAEGLNGFYYTGTNRSAFFNILNHPSLGELRQGIERLEEQVAQLNRQEFNKAQRARKRELLKQLHYYRNRRNQLVEKLNRTVVQHETAHHLLYDGGVHVIGAPNPVWLVEGLAVLFETPPSAKGAGIGVTNQMRLADFRAACGEKLDPQKKRPRKMMPENLRTAYDAGRFIPLRRFITLHRFSEDPSNPNVGYYYAQAWGLTFYLQRTQREELARYINALAKRTPGEPVAPEEELAQFEAVFGLVDARFERRWAAFIFNLRFVPEYPDG